MGYSAVVVTFYPEEKHFRNIQKIATEINTVFVIDNTDKDIKFPEFPENVIIIKNNKNLGIAEALNIGLKKSYYAGFKGCFLFDQDSEIPKGFIKKMIDFKESLRDKRVLLVAPNFFDINAKVFSSFFKLERFSLKRLPCKGIIYPSLVITSGSLLDLRAVEKVGYFDKEYFIDLVDNEYCLRLLKHGYKIAVNCDIVLKHSIGKRIEKRFLFFKLRPNYHTPLRRFYIFRNSIITAKRYFSFRPSIVLWVLRIMIHETVSILFFEKNKKKKLLSAFKGLMNGFFF